MTSHNIALSLPLFQVAFVIFRYKQELFESHCVRVYELLFLVDVRDSKLPDGGQAYQGDYISSRMWVTQIEKGRFLCLINTNFSDQKIQYGLITD